MRIRSDSIVEMLRKMDEAELKAGIAFSSSSEEDLQAALEKMRELRQMLYSALAQEEEPQAISCPVVCPAAVSYRKVPWWEQVTCESGTGTAQ